MRNFVIMIDDGSSSIEPCEVELADLQSVRVEAVRLLGQKLAMQPYDFWKSMGWHLSVQNEDGLKLFELHTVAVDAPVMQGVSPTYKRPPPERG